MNVHARLALAATASTSVADRIDALDWQSISHDLDARGNAHIKCLLSPDECRSLAALYPEEDRFRSRVVMQRHGFGSGEYKYFTYPLPMMISELRSSFYVRLVAVANRWNSEMDIAGRFPAKLADYLACCHAAGQMRPTPLLLKYGPNDYNCLHQDLYGEQVFPLQIAILLSAPMDDFTGGEFVITEQRPRMQSRPEVISLCQGDAVVFAVAQRPVRGKRSVYRVNLRHGISRIRTGQRITAGLIFHDAE